MFYGGFLLAVITSAIYMRLAHLPGRRVADCVAPGLALAQGLGRIGCFLGGCCWGTPTNLLVGVIFNSEQAHAITGVPLHVKLHPTQLYEAALVLLAIPFLLRLKKYESFDGEVVLVYVFYYAFVSFFLEFLRGDSREYYSSAPVRLRRPVKNFCRSCVFATTALLLALKCMCHIFKGEFHNDDSISDVQITSAAFSQRHSSSVC